MECRDGKGGSAHRTNRIPKYVFHSLSLLPMHLTSRFLLLCATYLAAGMSYGFSASIAGRVISLFGTPLSGAHVAVSAGQRIAEAVSGENGEYRIDDLPAGRLKVIVNLVGFGREVTTVGVGSADAFVLQTVLTSGNLVDLPPIEVIGRITGPRGAPLAGERILIVNCFNDRVRFETTTNASGRYHIDIREPGQYALRASPRGMLPVEVIFIAPATLPREHKVVDVAVEK